MTRHRTRRDVATVLWRRLDVPGHDACRLVQTAGGHVLEGAAVFRDARGVAALRYEVACDRRWRSRRGRVTGWVAGRAVDAAIARTSRGWTLGGDVVEGVADCLDLDFGFTPATNLFSLRRLALSVGERAAFPVAWFDAGARTLVRLPQVYERIGAHAYRYASPTVRYRAVLRFGPDGFVRSYPRLWRT
jgi:hypothetical protein